MEGQPRNDSQADRQGTAIGLMLVWVVVVAAASWFFCVLVKALGGGVLPAEQVLFMAGGLAGLATALTFAGLAFAGARPLLRLTSGAMAVLIINIGAICMTVATPMESDWYAYSLLDRRPVQAGQIIAFAGTLALGMAIFGDLIRQRFRGTQPGATPPQ